MAWTRQRITFTVGVAIVVTDLVVGALLVRGSTPMRRVSATTAPSPSPRLRSPFTGEPVSSLDPVLAVKMDNDAAALPRTVHWSRPSADGGTTFTTASGRPATFARGQVWVVLAYP